MESGFTKTIILFSLIALNLFAKQGIQSGDLIFRRGEGFISDIATNMSPHDKKYSHVGMILVQNNKTFVIHSQNDKDKNFDGVVKEEYNNFIAKALYFSIFRLNLPKKKLQEIIQKAKNQIGKKFDMEFNLKDNSKLYCTEFIYLILKNHIPIKTHKINQTNTIPIDSLYYNQPKIKKILTQILQ